MDAKQFLVWLVLFLVTAGCRPQAGQPTAKPATAASASQTKSADEVLKSLIHAYQDAAGYGDQGILRLSYEMDGETHQDSAVLAVRLERPNRIRVQVYQVDIACDGRELMARITDESTNNIDEQWLVRAAPPSLSLANLLDDSVLYDVVSSGLGRLPIQLELLLGEAPLQEFMSADVQRELLEDRSIEGARCYRVGVTTGEGQFVLWIDQQTLVLRRFEYPPGILLANLPPQQNAEHVQLVAEFEGARLTATAGDEQTYSLPIPDAARRVRYFVRPPQPLPSNLFGQRVDQFQFTQLDGSQWSSAALASKIAVLHWYVDHPACQASMQQWEQVRRQYADHPDVQFMAVCVEPSAVPETSIRDLLQQWEIEAPVVRDLNTTGPSVFGVGPLPAVVVLDSQSVVQAFWVTYNPDLANQLPTAIDQLLAGQDLAAQALAQTHNETAEYHYALSSAGADVNAGQVTARTIPQHWRLTQAWEAPFHEPGNMVLVSRGDEQRLYVIDEGRVVLELDSSGRSLGAHRLAVPESESVTHLRASADGSERVAFSYGGRRAYWLDEKWQLLRAVPDLRVNHDGIRDAAFVKSGDGELLVVAAAGVGLLGISPAGKVEWQLDQSQPQSLAVHSPANQLVVADASGRIFGVGVDGQEKPVADRQGAGVFRLWSVQAPPGPDGAAMLGLSFDTTGRRLIFGLNEQFQALWEYQAAADPFHFPTEFVSSGQFPDGQTFWVLASADGAIHLLSADGKQFDYFFTGHHISGLQVWHDARQRPMLIVGSENAVTAWRLEPALETPVSAAGGQDL